MPRWHFRNRSHPGKGMCRMGAVSGAHGHESGFDLFPVIFQVSLGLCLWSVLPDDSPTMADGGTSQALHGAFAAPRAATCHGTPAAGCLTQLDCCWRCAGAGSALLAAACLPYSSELCPSPLLSCCAAASRLYWVFNYHNIQCRCYAKQPVRLSTLNSGETQLNKSIAIIPGGWLEPQDTSVISCGFYVGRCRFQPLESSYPTDNN